MQMLPCVEEGMPGVAVQVPSTILLDKKPVWVMLMLGSRKLSYHAAPPPPPDEPVALAAPADTVPCVRETAASEQLTPKQQYDLSHYAHVYNADGSRKDGKTQVDRDQKWRDLRWELLPCKSDGRGDGNFH